MGFPLWSNRSTPSIRRLRRPDLHSVERHGGERCVVGHVTCTGVSCGQPSGNPQVDVTSCRLFTCRTTHRHRIVQVVHSCPQFPSVVHTKIHRVVPLPAHRGEGVRFETSDATVRVDGWRAARRTAAANLGCGAPNLFARTVGPTMIRWAVRDLRATGVNERRADRTARRQGCAR